MHETLAHYLNDTGTSQSDFARQVGCTQGMVWQILNGKTRPGLMLCLRIEKATGGRVRAETLSSRVDWSLLRERAS